MEDKLKCYSYLGQASRLFPSVGSSLLVNYVLVNLCWSVCVGGFCSARGWVWGFKMDPDLDEGEGSPLAVLKEVLHTGVY